MAHTPDVLDTVVILNEDAHIAIFCPIGCPEQQPPYHRNVGPGEGSEEVPTCRKGGKVWSGNRIMGLRPTPDKLWILQIPRKPSVGHGRQLVSGRGKPPEGTEEVDTIVADSGE